MNDYYEPIRHVVTPAEEGWLLKTVLQRCLHVSRSLLVQLKRTEYGIMLNGSRVFINVKVTAGDVVEIRMLQEYSDDILPQPLPIHILYEDDHLLIVNKEAGMIVHPTIGHYTNTLANGVVYHWQQAGVKHRFRPIHRLDQYTSGIVAIAKNRYVHHLLSEALKSRQIDRHYVALVHGCVLQSSGTIDAPIDRAPDDPHRRMVTVEGYPAITHYEVIKRYAHMTMIRATLETGRTHQIRVHFQHIGHPLLGDPLYGVDDRQIDPIHPLQIDRQALHAIQLSFAHPLTKKSLTFKAPLPPDMEKLVAEASPLDMN